MNLMATLILTFSLREKEPPLPSGEGWGEGKLTLVSMNNF
jgi:hypothetical protein